MNLFYISALGCMPLPNPPARLRELEIGRQVAALNLQQARIGLNGRRHGRWDGNEKPTGASATQGS